MKNVRLALVCLVALLACKGGKKEERSAASAAPSSGSSPAAAAPSWVDNVTGDGFTAWVNSHPGGCDCSVKDTKKDGKISVVTWQIHSPGDDHYMSFLTTVSEHAGQGSKLSYEVGQKYPGCIRSDVGNKLIVNTRCVAMATSAVYPNGKHEVKPCEGSGWSLPDGMQSYFEK